MKDYVITNLSYPDIINKGPGRSGPPGPPGPALIYQKSNSGIEPMLTETKDRFQAAENEKAVMVILEQLPSRLKKKMFALRARIEFLVQTYGIEHVGLQTLTIRENVTDRKEFQRRFKSISTNVFPKIYEDWIRVFERQERGAWHAHVVVATKEDIRTGTDVAQLNQVLKDKRDRKIAGAIYYSRLKRLASPNLRGIWKEFRRLCGIREFKARRQGKNARYYKFDACHLLPIINSAKALATYVSKYISKGFQNRRPEDKGMRLVGCSKRVAKACGEHFTWGGGAGKLWRTKLGTLASMVGFESMDDFADSLGRRWAYHIRPAVDALVLPRYDDMRLAKADGWDLVNTTDGSPWPWADLDLPAAQVREAQGRAFQILTDLIARKRGRRQIPEPAKRMPKMKELKPIVLEQAEWELGLSRIIKD